MILDKPVLPDVVATISAGTAPVTIQAPCMDRFSRHVWRGNGVTDPKSDLLTDANCILARAYELAVRAVELDNQFNPVVEFAVLFNKETQRELPRLWKINHKIKLIPGSSCIPTYRPSGDRIKEQITDKINSVQISGRVYRAEGNTNAIVMCTQPKGDRPKQPRCLPECRPRKTVTIRNHTSLPNIEEVIEFVAARPLRNQIDLSDRNLNIRIDTDSEKHTTFLCHMGSYRSRVMQERDCNAAATMIRAMNKIFRDMIHKDLIIYIDYIIISRQNYQQHIEAVRKVLQRLQH